MKQKLKYITVKYFLKQPKKAREIFLEWWKPSEGDLFIDIVDTTIVECIDYKSEDGLYHTHRGNLSQIEDMIPLFTEGTLRSFIEEISNGNVRIEANNASYGYGMGIFKDNTEFIRGWCGLEYNLLHSYWNVACDIAKERANNMAQCDFSNCNYYNKANNICTNSPREYKEGICCMCDFEYKWGNVRRLPYKK